MIQLKNIKYKYKSGDYILNNINLEIQQGESVCIIGKNGSGKSTLAKLIAGIVKPSEGEILIDEIDTSKNKNFEIVRKKIGIVFQNPDTQILFNNVTTDMQFALNNLKIEDKEQKISNALKQVDMYEYKNSDSFELSLGQKQRVNIASVLAIDTKYIVLDEPTTMIDSYGKEKIYNIIKELKKKQKTIIYITNNMNEILLADKVIVIENGKIKYYLDKADILNNPNILEQCEIKVPEVIEIALRLKKIGIEINTDVECMQDMIDNIIEVIQNEKNY